MPNSRRDQRGQVLLMVAASMFVLLAITALVIDLGFSWMLHRQEQNAADPAAIAAARHLRDPLTGAAVDPATVANEMFADACFYAHESRFFQNDPDCSSVRGSGLIVNSPPHSGQFVGRAGYVEVVVVSSHAAFFSRILGRDEVTVTTSAVAANSTSGSYTSSLHALDPTGCHAGQVQGNGGPSSGAKVSITPMIDPSTGLPYSGGFVQVNSSCDGPVDPAALAACGGGDGALKVGGSSSLSAPGIFTYGDCGRDGGAAITTSEGNMVHQGALPVGDPLAELRGPVVTTGSPGASCGIGGIVTNASTNNAGCGSGGAYEWKWVACPDDATIRCVTLNPGVYFGGWDLKTNKYRLLLNPGVYVIAGGGIKQTGSAIQAVSGDGTPATAQVLIYSTDNPAYSAACASNWATVTGSNPERCQGPIDFTAGASFRAYGIGDFACSIDPASCPYKGLLIWQDGRSSCPLLACDIGLGGGTAALSVGGTVYAPKQLVTLNGSGAVAGDVAAIQIISYRWKIVGNSQIEMPYDPSAFYQLPQRGLVQ